MKKIFFALLLSVSMYSYAYDFEKDGIYYAIKSNTEKTCGVAAGEIEGGYMGEITIPSTVNFNNNEYTVTQILSGAFNKCKLLEKITIPGTITDIGTTYATTFDECIRLKQIVFEDGVETLHLGYGKNGGTFIDSPLDSIYLGRNLDYKSATNYSSHPAVYSPFAQIQTLRSVFVSPSVEILPHSLFYGCTGLARVTGMEGVKTIESSTFRSWTTTAGVFQNCTSLETIILPDNITYLGDYAFYGCTNLKDVYLGRGITAFGGKGTYGPSHSDWQAYGCAYIFEKCNLRNLYLGSEVTHIGKCGLYNSELTIQNMYIFSDKLIVVNNQDQYGIPSSTNIYVIDPSQYTNLLSGYNLKSLLTFNNNEYEYSGEIPEFSYKNNVKNTSVSFYEESIDLNVGNYNTDIKTCFSHDIWNMIVYIPGAFSITKAPLMIIANDKTMSYGDNVPELDCSYLGLKNNETPDVALSKFPTLFTSAKKGSNVGDYPINISGASAKNYNISYTNGTLQITKAKQTISWNQDLDNHYVGDIIDLNGVSSCGLPITYISSDESIAIVSESNGKQVLHLIKDGIVKITATQNGNENYESAVEVSKSFNVIAKVATNITLNQSSIRLKEGESATLLATIYPESVVEKGVEWSSSNKDVVIVNNGMVTAIKVGTATITARTIDGSNLEATCNVIVDPVLASAITLNTNSVSTTIGDPFSLTYEIKPENVTYKGVTWVSSNTDVATVEGGYVQTKAVGSALISVKTTDGTNLTATCNVTVNPILVSSINLSSSTLNLNVGEYATLSVTITPDNATNKNVEWSSSNNSIASVSNGVVTAITSGSCIIKAKTTDGSEIESSCVVTVANIPVTNLTLDKESIEILVDEKATITANVYPANATNQTLSWTSSNGNVATVDGGLVTARGAGETVITVRSTDGSDKMATCNVVVKKHQQTIEWNQDLSSIMYGGELIEIHAEASSGLPVVYSSSNDNVISIFDMGSVVYLNPINVGTSVITVTQAGNRYYEEISVSKEAKVIDPSGVNNIMASDGKYIVTSINGIRIGVYSEEDYQSFLHNGNKGLFIVNGSKILIK